jgi:hypothetical protein
VSITKSVRNLIFYLHYCFWNFSQFLAIYFEQFSSGVILIRKTLTKWVPPVRRRCLRWAHLAARHCRVAATCHACALNVMSGPRAGVPTAPRRSDCAPFRPHRRRCPNLLASPRPVPTTPSPLSKAAPPPCLNPGAVQPSDAVASFIHGVHRTSSPLAVLHPWSVELTFPSLLSVAGPPSATVAHLVGKTLPPSRISSPHRRGCSTTAVCAATAVVASPPSRRCVRGPSATVHLGRAWFWPSGTQIDFSIFRIYLNSCTFKNLCRIHFNSENYETNFVGKVLICTRL